MDKEKELKKLLAEERVRSNNRRSNFEKLREIHLKLQEDYLASKGELKEVLEHTKAIKQRQDEELQQVKGQLEEKLKQVDFYLNELKEKEKFEEQFKEKCKQEIEELGQRMKKECECLRLEKMRLVSEKGLLKQRLEHVEQECEIAARNLMLEHQNELAALTKEKDDLRAQFREAKKHPDYEKLVKLTNENQQLKEQLAALRALVDETVEKYRLIDDERERLIAKQNEKLKSQEAKLANGEQETERQRLEAQQLRADMVALDGQLKAMKNSLADERAAREQLAAQHANELRRKQKEKDELRQHLKEEKIKFELEIDKLKQEKKKLKNDYEDAKDEVRKLENAVEQKEKDCSKELSKAVQVEKDKIHALLKEKQSLVMEKEEAEDSLRKMKDECGAKQKQIDDALASKYELEKEGKQLRSQIERLKLGEAEAEKLRKELDALYEEFKQLRMENSELNSLTKQLNRENVTVKEQFNMYRQEVEEEKKQFYEFKQNAERNQSRLKNSFELERNALREEVEELRDAIRAEKRKRTDVKLKAVQYCEVAKKLHHHLKQLENEDRSKLFRPTAKGVRAIGHPATRSTLGRSASESNEIQSNLRKQYKEMKKKLNEIQNSDYCKLHQPAS